MRRRVLLCLTLITMGACNGDRIGTPVDPSATSPSNDISDATHSSVDLASNPDFFFLPPMVKNPSASPAWNAGAFNGKLRPTVEICASAAATEDLISESACTALPSLTAIVDLVEEHYKVNWKVPSDATKFYRLTVKVGATRLGFADVATGGNAAEVKSLASDEIIPLVDGRTLPIKFRVERFALCAVPGTGPCESEFVDFNAGGEVATDVGGSGAQSGIIFALAPTPPPGSPPPSGTVTVQGCGDFHVREVTDLPTFGPCLRVTIEPALTAPLPALALVYSCDVSAGGVAAGGITAAQAERIAMHRLAPSGNFEALSHADPECAGAVASVGTLRGVFAALRQGQPITAAKQMMSMLAPKPLYAARFIDLGGGGLTDLPDEAGGGVGSRAAVSGARLSVSASEGPSQTINEFQFALPAKFQVDATPTDLSGAPGAPLNVSVKVTDLADDPVQGARVRFIVDNGGTVVPAIVDGTNSDGLASVVWTLGTTPGVNTLTASGRGIAGTNANGPRGGLATIDPFQPLHTHWGDETTSGVPVRVLIGSMTVMASSSQCTNGSATDCNPADATLITASAFVDPTPPAGYKQCAGFINTVGDDVRWDWENNCIPFKSGALFVRVYNDATGQIIGGARVFSGVALTWSPESGFNYSADAFEGEGLVNNVPPSSGLPGGVSLAWHTSDASYCGCGRPGGGVGTCNDIFTANAANDKILYVGGNSSNHNYEAVWGPPGPKNTCSLNSEIVRLRIAIYAPTLSSSQLRIPSQTAMTRFGAPSSAPAKSSADVCSSYLPNTEHATQRPPDCP